MSVFDSLWDQYSGILDERVDAVVGDRIRYRRDGQWLGDAELPVEERVIPGFILFYGQPRGIDEVDETLGTRKRVKIAMALIGDEEPDRSDRIQHPKLGPGFFQPSGSDPETEGRYWLFDVQKASA